VNPLVHLSRWTVNINSRSILDPGRRFTPAKVAITTILILSICVDRMGNPMPNPEPKSLSIIGRFSNTRAEVSNIRDPVDLPYDLGFPTPAAGDRFAALEIELTNESQTTQEINIAYVRVLGKNKRALNYSVVPGELIRTQHLEPSAMTKCTLYVYVPAKTELGAVTFISDAHGSLLELLID
jgi:hypothetical protein